MANCRSCGAPVLWVIVRPTGRRMPLDPEPDEAGNVLVDLPAGMGLVLSAASVALVREQTPDQPLYVSHFATCPNADEWRRD